MTRPFLCLLLLVAATGCGGKSDSAPDCSERCQPDGSCPDGRFCQLGYCVKGGEDPRRCPELGASGSGAASTSSSSGSSSTTSAGSTASSTTSGSSTTTAGSSTSGSSGSAASSSSASSGSTGSTTTATGSTGSASSTTGSVGSTGSTTGSTTGTSGTSGTSGTTGCTDREVVTADGCCHAEDLCGVRCCNLGTGLFTTPTLVSTCSEPRSVAIGDVTSDGTLDLVTACRSSALLYASPAVASGGFGAPLQSALVSSGRHVVLADMDRDGKLDAVVSSYSYRAADVLSGQGDGTFAAATGAAGSVGDGWVTLGDVDGDGLLDVIDAQTLSSGSGQVMVRLGLPDGGLQTTNSRVTTAPDYPVLVPGSPPRIIVTNAVGSSAVLSSMAWVGQALQPPTTVSIPQPAGSMLTGDLDHDGLSDLVVVGKTTGALMVLRGKNATTWATASSFTCTGAGGFALAGTDLLLQDLDGDGQLDVVGSVPGVGLGIYRGEPDGGFACAGTIAFAGQPYGIAAADLDGDRRIDLAVTIVDGGTVDIFYGR